MRPTVRSRRLGARLSRYRTEHGISGAALAAQHGIGQLQLSRLETGKAKIAPAALERLVEVFGILDEDARKLDELRRRSTEPGWWQDYGDILSEPVEMLIELEVRPRGSGPGRPAATPRSRPVPEFALWRGQRRCSDL